MQRVLQLNGRAANPSPGDTDMHHRAKQLLKSFLNDECGQDLIEYALVAALIALGSIAALGSLTNQIGNEFNSIGNSLWLLVLRAAPLVVSAVFLPPFSALLPTGRCSFLPTPQDKHLRPEECFQFPDVALFESEFLTNQEVSAMFLVVALAGTSLIVALAGFALQLAAAMKGN
jgi:pilus assembly protein Flp/PilA